MLTDLTQYSDDQIKGNVLLRVVALLFKHIFDPDIADRLTGILSLLADLSRKNTGTEYLETLLRYLLTTVEEISAEGIKTIIENSLPGIDGALVMTLAEKWKQEGYQKGIQQGVQQGVLQGLYEGIELALIVKFGSTPEKDRLLDLIKNVQSVDRLKQIKSAILEVETVAAIAELIERLLKQQ